MRICIFAFTDGVNFPMLLRSPICASFVCFAHNHAIGNTRHVPGIFFHHAWFRIATHVGITTTVTFTLTGSHGHIFQATTCVGGSEFRQHALWADVGPALAFRGTTPDTLLADTFSRSVHSITCLLARNRVHFRRVHSNLLGSNVKTFVVPPVAFEEAFRWQWHLP